jgi:hypothetical protein
MTCDHCGKPIKGRVIHFIPLTCLVLLGTDRPLRLHPKCFRARTGRTAPLDSEEIEVSP